MQQLCSALVIVMHKTPFSTTFRIQCKHDFLTSRSCGDLRVSKCCKRCSSVRACSTHVSNFFTMSIASKCREIDCGATERSDPSWRTIDVDRSSTFCL
ncbi:hypothetical protein TNCT_219991 [Trichonephila clavata]|uniref:Uncharacterized protein n=1 Tax=Trichonephila clavata TaxID=2740835 RepID=A0A8X6F6J2_TRICU|nr:hypothetical protein TNCT_219991 [Trichonephila clavata]